MSEPELSGARVPSRTLAGEQEAAYIRTLVSALRAARLGAHYPDPGALTSHLGVLMPEVHRGLYSGLEVDLRSGLPTYKEWIRAKTDVGIAEGQLRQLGPRAELEARARSSDIHARQLRKHEYYTDIRGAQLAPLGDMRVALRRHEPERNRAAFHVVLDKLDASGLFVRYSVDLVQTAAAWRERVVVLDEETSRHTEAFRALIYKLTSLDAELTLVKLASMGGIEVERVVKGVVGPLWMPWARAPDDVARLVAAPGGFAASFALDMAAVDVAEDRDNDPFEDLASERLSPEGREGYEQVRKRVGYRVFKDRKLVVPRGSLAAARQLCEARGTKNIVYGV